MKLRAGDGTKALLSGCVPNLQLHPLPIDFHRFNLKINPSRIDNRFSGSVTAPSTSFTRFASADDSFAHPIVVMKLVVN